MKLCELSWLLLILSLCYSMSCKAMLFNSEKAKDSNEPIEIQSDSAHFDQITGNAVHRGHVLATQGQRRLKSDVLTIHRNFAGKIDAIISEGGPASFEIVEDPEKPKIYGKAKTLQYFPKENKIVLQRAAELKQNDNTIQAATIIYYLDSGKLVTDSNQEERTTVIIQSKSQL